MSVFIWTFLVMALIEVGGSITYLSTGVIPKRTRYGMAINLVIWACTAAWAASLLFK